MHWTVYVDKEWLSKTLQRNDMLVEFQEWAPTLNNRDIGGLSYRRYSKGSPNSKHDNYGQMRYFSHNGSKKKKNLSTSCCHKHLKTCFKENMKRWVAYLL